MQSFESQVTNYIGSIKQYDQMANSISLQFNYSFLRDRTFSFGIKMNVESSELAFNYEQTVAIFQAIVTKLDDFMLPSQYTQFSIASISDLDILCKSFHLQLNFFWLIYIHAIKLN